MKKIVLYVLVMLVLLTTLAIAQEGKGSLKVETVPENATVYIDDKPEGTTPLIISNISAGKHRLVIKKDGYHTAERVIDIPADDVKSVKILLTPLRDTPRQNIPPPIPPTPVRTEDKKYDGVHFGIRGGLFIPTDADETDYSSSPFYGAFLLTKKTKSGRFEFSIDYTTTEPEEIEAYYGLDINCEAEIVFINANYLVTLNKDKKDKDSDSYFLIGLGQATETVYVEYSFSYTEYYWDGWDWIPYTAYYWDEVEDSYSTMTLNLGFGIAPTSPKGSGFEFRGVYSFPLDSDNVQGMIFLSLGYRF